MLGQSKIKAVNPIVNLDGDEMTRVIWSKILNELILPYVDIDIKYYDIGILNRDATDNKVTLEAANAINEFNVAVKCATITPDEKRVAEFKLKQMWKSANGTISNVVRGTSVRAPIMLKTIPKSIPGWIKPIIITRHAFGDQYHAKDVKIDRPGTLELVYTDDRGHTQRTHVYDFDSPGIAMAMFNTHPSIANFAHSSFKIAIENKMPLYLSTKNTILVTYDGKFVEVFAQIYEEHYREQFERLGITYEHRLIDDMVALAIKSSGGFVWACKNYDGDVQSDVLAQGFASLGMMTSELITSDGRTLVAEAAHGTVTRHFRQHEQGLDTSTNPVACIFAWTRALAHRAKLDNTPQLAKFAQNLEAICVENIDVDGILTKDLASAIQGENLREEHYVNTRTYFQHVRNKLNAIY